MKWERKHESKETIISKLKNLAEDLGKSPTWIECMNLSDISLSRLNLHFGTLNKALVAAGLPINRKRKSTKRGRNQRQSHGVYLKKYRIVEPAFKLRICNVCDRKFKAEDDMRSCPVCTNTKRNAENRGGFIDTDFGFSYFS